MARILLVGGAGTLGADIIDAQDPIHEYFVIDNFIDASLTPDEVGKKVDFKNMSVANIVELEEVFDSFEPQIIMYLSTSLSNDPATSFDSNVLGMQNIIHLSEARQRPHILYFQSFLTRTKSDIICESTPVEAQDQYSTWKLAAEYLLSGYSGPKTILILASVLSSRISVGAIPSFVKKISANEKVYITKSARDYLTTKNFLDGLRFIVDSPLGLNTIVLGSQTSTETSEIFKVVSKILQSEDYAFEEIEPKPSDPKSIVLNSSKFQALFPWKPERDYYESIHLAVNTINSSRKNLRLHH
jgi:nucleoside-diphosphate-sugar epimerase